MLFHKIIYSVLCIALLLFYGCATSYAPDNWLPNTDQIQKEAYGGWLTLYVADYSTTQNDGVPAEISGEFISSDSNNVYLLTVDNLRTINKSEIKEAILELDDKNTGEYSIWTTLGTLSTLSHGKLLIFSAPLWLIIGISAASGESFRDRYVEELPATTYWEEVQKFARFPQGIPLDLDLNELKPKSNPEIQYD